MSESPSTPAPDPERNAFSVSLPNGECFHAQINENLLVAAQRAHWLIRFGCRNGNCEACAATLMAGHVMQRGEAIDAAQEPQKILLCLAQARSDLQIVLAENPQHGGMDQARRCYAQLLDVHELSSGEWSNTFYLPAGKMPSCFPGQRALIEAVSEMTSEVFAEIETQNDCVGSDRKLVLISAARPALAVGERVFLRYPLGYAYRVINAGHIQAEKLCLLYEPSTASRARRLQNVYRDALAIDMTADMTAVRHGWPVSAEPLQFIALATTAETVGAWYAEILEAGIEFTVMRSDFGILKSMRGPLE